MVLKKEPIFRDLYSVSVGPFIWVFTRVQVIEMQMHYSWTIVGETPPVAGKGEKPAWGGRPVMFQWVSLVDRQWDVGVLIVSGGSVGFLA